MHDFTKLEVYHDSVRWAASVRALCRKLPPSEEYGLSSQLRRCASSVPANIAEGAGRGGDKEFSRFLHIAIGSLCEFEAHVDVSIASDLLTDDDVESLRESARTLRKRIAVLERTVANRR